jgi:hypothetical protein
MLEKLFDEVFEDSAVYQSLEHTIEKHTVLSICGKNLMPTVSIELRNLDRRNTER